MSPRPPTRRVRACELSPGDVLSPTGAIVVNPPSCGIATPAGCVDLAVRYPRQGADEPAIRRTWRRGTMIAVRSDD